MQVTHIERTRHSSVLRSEHFLKHGQGLPHRVRVELAELLAQPGGFNRADQDAYVLYYSTYEKFAGWTS